MNQKATPLSDKSVLPAVLQGWVAKHPDALIEEYLLCNLSNPSTLTLNPNVISIEYASNQRYIGQFGIQDQVRYRLGRGVYKHSNLDVYLGDWRNDVFHGLGIYIFANKDLFSGLFQNGYATKGLMIYQDGSMYEGQFKDGYREGHGIMRTGKIIKSGEVDPSWEEVYEGEWLKNAKNGRGVLKYGPFELAGTWENDQVKGHVTLFSSVPNASICYYSGLMAKNEFIKGKCKLHFGQNICYEGEISLGHLDGRGQLSQEPSQKSKYQYFGDFKNGTASGHGRLKITPAKSTLVFDQCVLDYEGDVHKNKAEGLGRIVYTNGDIYEGHLVLGQKQGHGKYMFNNGDIYQGQFLKDRIEGEGEYCWPRLGLCCRGKFQNNRLLYSSEAYQFGTPSSFSRI